jgi:PAP2 superfamily
VTDAALPTTVSFRRATLPRWWTQVGMVVGVALVVVLVVPLIAPPSGVPTSALGNAVSLVDIERFFGLFFEHRLQRLALGFTPIVIAANWWYGVMHFVVTAAVFVWLFRRYRADYPRWRNTFAITSVLTLGIQAVWPATPPRLLAGAAHTPHFVDALSTFSSPWSFSSKGGVANQYAAMPSMHIAWAVIVACIVIPRTSRRWVRVCAALYPVVTTLAIMITGNHYIIDAIGAVAIVAIGYGLARALERWRSTALVPR